jgi:hypothetical protein
MCYETLRHIDGQTVGRLVREELPNAIRDGLITAGLVAVVLALAGVSLPLVAAGAAAGLVVTVPVHLAVLVAGVCVLRWRRRRQPAVPQAS